MDKTTLVIGASENPARHSNIAVKRLRSKNFPVRAIGLKEGMIGDVTIETGFPAFENIHTVTLYINASHQPVYYDYLLLLNPKRIIFNPGTENDELAVLAQKNGIETMEACTLVMLSIGIY